MYNKKSYFKINFKKHLNLYIFFAIINICIINSIIEHRIKGFYYEYIQHLLSLYI